jgi:hypothetical protein
MKSDRDRKLAKQLARQLIALADGKGEAIRIIRLMKTSRKSGRPKGTLAYRALDVQLLNLVGCLKAEYRVRGQKPSERTLIRKIVNLCWEATPSDAVDESICSLLDLRGRLGPSRESTMARLLTRVQGPRSISPNELAFDPADLRRVATGKKTKNEFPIQRYFPPSGLWKELHQTRPDVKLLTGGSKYKK